MAKVAVRRSSTTPPSSLLTGLKSYWKLDEASGVRYDAHGANHLTPSGTVTAQAGRVGNGAQMLIADAPSYLAKADPVGLGFTSSFTVAWWSYVHTLAEWGTYRGNMAYCEYVPASGGLWNIYGFLAKAAFNGVMAWLAGHGDGTDIITHAWCVPGQWNFYVAWADADTHTIDIIVNNGASNVQAVSGGAIVGPSASVDFQIGSSEYHDDPDGIVDEVGIWSRLLTPAERTALYNAGAGVTYPFTGV